MRRLALKAVQEHIEGGLADGKSLEDIAKKHGVTLDHIEEQMKMGVQVEMEHTNDANIATEIARDHLWEDPDYYTKLAKMEGEGDNVSDIYIPLLKSDMRVETKEQLDGKVLMQAFWVPNPAVKADITVDKTEVPKSYITLQNMIESQKPMKSSIGSYVNFIEERRKTTAPLGRGYKA